MDSKADKLWKKTVRDRQKRIKPGECQKYIRVVIDANILSTFYGKELISALSNATSKILYDLRTLPIKESIIWERNTGQLALNHNDVNGLSDVWQRENQVAIILTHVELLHMAKLNTLSSIAENFHKHHKNMQHIVLFLRSNEKLNSIASSALLELQIVHQLKVMEVRNPTVELAKQVMCLTKAIAELPFKKQKSEVQGSFKKFLANDKKKCVRIEGTNGFGRLWQQHLNRLPLVTLEVAETIIDKYSCPKMLLDGINTNTNFVKEMSDLKVKRSGPVALQTDRRIGNVLANKILNLYNARDPTTLI